MEHSNTFKEAIRWLKVIFAMSIARLHPTTDNR